MKADCVCHRCGTAFQIAARFLKHGRGRFCSSACSSASAGERRWALHAERFAEYFWAKVDKSGGGAACWPWKGRRLDAGYGRLVVNGKHVGANRIAYELTYGPLGGLFACHTCDNPSCCNPAHLFAGTHSDNMADRKAKGRYATGAAHHSALKALRARVQP